MSAPSIYLFHGDDEPAIKAATAALVTQLGDPSTAEMNTAHFEGSLSLDALTGAAMAMPFLSARRVVSVLGAAKTFNAAEPRAAFIRFLEQIPASTAFVIQEFAALDAKHWLLKWVQAAGSRAQVQRFELPKGPQMAAWLQQRTTELGGTLQPQAAVALVQLLGSDKLAADGELAKLLAYVDYSRPIQAQDVQLLCQPIGEQGDFFGLLDSLVGGNPAQAMNRLETLLQERDHILFFFSLVGHFRLLVQTRQLMDAGLKAPEIAKELSIHPFRAEKLAGQARRFSARALKALYQRLFTLDQEMKTGKIEPSLAMETFVAALSVPTA
ncbi:MAG: DNA polymerase III subunit delta [Anaerolineales bacterium]|nr:DNA polymerase III subunit delta [Anaerolineales bacterium]